MDRTDGLREIVSKIWSLWRSASILLLGALAIECRRNDGYMKSRSGCSPSSVIEASLPMHTAEDWEVSCAIAA